MTDRNIDILVIGAGPAGLAAAIAAREAGISSLLVIDREKEPGGILRQCIHNGFGLHRFKEELTGPEYAQKDIDRAAELGIPIECSTMVLSVSRDRLVTCVSPVYGIQRILAKAVVLAMGCRERPRGALCTPGTRCAGIYSAGTAQRFVNLEGFMPGKRVVILGKKSHYPRLRRYRADHGQTHDAAGSKSTCLCRDYALLLRIKPEYCAMPSGLQYPAVSQSYGNRYTGASPS